MKLEYDILRDKILGCWTGKNVGGVLGAPLEGYRGVHDIEFYLQDFKGNPPANDDLDLQLIWLNAVERYGRTIDAKILGEYWLSYIIPEWNEYGVAKHNLQAGFLPPISGYLDNPYRDSCGCFIRSEIWACLAPGHPDIAARYAYEDGIVDHSTDGLFAEIFCAALQSSAFVETDSRKLIEIGLSYIPADSGVYKGIKTVCECYDNGDDWKTARKRLFNAVPGTFGEQITPIKDIEDKETPLGKPGWDAPGNIGIIIIGWLYGEGDFGKSLCIAVNCGEDTDCTAATLGAILGIIHGASNLPAKWVEPTCDIINTICINNLSDGLWIPKTCTELTDRVLGVIPAFLGPQWCNCLGDGISIETEKDMFPVRNDEFQKGISGLGKFTDYTLPEMQKLQPFAVMYKFPAFDVALDYMQEPYLKASEPRKLKLIFKNNGLLRQTLWLDINIHAPENVQVSPGKSLNAHVTSLYNVRTEFEIEVLVEDFVEPRIDIIFDISSKGRHTSHSIKATLIPDFRVNKI